MSEYNMPPIGLFGKRCKIPTGIYKEPYVYRIVNNGIKSNGWCEVPLMGYSEPTLHNDSEEILIVVSDTLINDTSRLIRVAKKDVEIMDENNGSIEEAYQRGYEQGQKDILEEMRLGKQRCIVNNGTECRMIMEEKE